MFTMYLFKFTQRISLYSYKLYSCIYTLYKYSVYYTTLFFNEPHLLLFNPSRSHRSAANSAAQTDRSTLYAVNDTVWQQEHKPTVVVCVCGSLWIFGGQMFFLSRGRQPARQDEKVQTPPDLQRQGQKAAGRDGLNQPAFGKI